MVHPAALAITIGVALGGAIFAIFYLGTRNQSNQYTYERRPIPDPLELIQNQLEA